MYRAGAARYKQVNVQTMSRGQILLALYDTAIQYCHRAAGSIRKGDVVAKGKEIQRVSSIVGELASTLDRGVAPEFCDQLEALYFYMQEQLALSNAKMEPEPVEEVAKILLTLREAWGQAVEDVEGNGARHQQAQAVAAR
jgi:flagellar protein FliS